jgi:hypothetical protein
MFPTLPEPPPGVCAVRFMSLPTMPMRLVAVLSLVAWGLVFVGAVSATAQQPAPGQRPAANAGSRAAASGGRARSADAAAGRSTAAWQASPSAGRSTAASHRYTPEQQAALDQLLAAWETRNAAVHDVGLHVPQMGIQRLEPG